MSQVLTLFDELWSTKAKKDRGFVVQHIKVMEFGP